MNTDKLVLLHGSLKNIYSCMVVVFYVGIIKTNLFRTKDKKGIKNGGFCQKST